MTPTEHQAFGLLVREMRYIATISSGQVHRIAMMTLEKVAALSPAQAVSEKDTQNVSTLEQPQADDLLQDVASYIGVGGYNGATPQQLADRIRAEFDRLQPQAQKDLVPQEWTNLLAYVLQDDIHNRLTPRVIDVAYTAFMMAKQPNTEDGGASDWFTDTRPTVRQMITKLRKDLIEEFSATEPQLKEQKT